MELEPVGLIQNKAAVPQEFNKIAARYDLATGMSQGYQADLDRSAALLELAGNERVLDLCCGTGKSTLAILPHLPAGNLIGVDNSEEMLKHARRKFDREISEGRTLFLLRDATALEFPDGSFDAIFMAYGLRNMPDYGKCLADLHRLLKPGGKLVIHDYSLSDTWYARPLWFVLGYFFIVPFCTIVTGSSGIFTYLVKSVLGFLTPRQLEALLHSKKFAHVTVHRHPSWRRPILHTFRAFRT